MDLRFGDCLEELQWIFDESIDSLVTDPPAGISFMGKGWDDDKGGRDGWIAWLTEVMMECHRVLKPGAYALVWAIPRTSHWTMTALENAGFEIRDVVTHLFGTGFPKSLDVSKAIDKEAGAKREVVGFDPVAAAKANKRPAGEMNARYRNSTAANDNGATITAPATDAARQWEGFGTALKPACEFWILCRKPIAEKTVAKNVLKYGTGALNIDGCRIGFQSEADRKAAEWGTKGGAEGWGLKPGAEVKPTNASGRFPSNLVISHSDDCDFEEEECAPDCAVMALDEQSGTLVSKWGKQKTRHDGDASMFGLGVPDDVNKYSGDSGGASRFFYCAKASKTDRGENNKHPTVKSTKLMEYLLKLVTPPTGIVLDPFMGSGSTGVAAIRAGFKFIGIEQEQEYFDTAKSRIKRKGA